MKIPAVSYGNGQVVFVSTPFLDGDNLVLTGTQPIVSGTSGPQVSFTDGDRMFAHVVNNTLNSIIVHGTAQRPTYGYVDIYPVPQSNVTLAHGGERPGKTAHIQAVSQPYADPPWRFEPSLLRRGWAAFYVSPIGERSPVERGDRPL